MEREETIPPETPEAPGGGAPDRWRKIEILGRPLSAFVTALAVAMLGLFGQMAISAREREVTRRAQHEQRARLYTEIMSRREEAASALRKDMFTAILTEFFEDSVSDTSTGLSRRLLRLEMLALNFGESLSLSPLFLEMYRDLKSLKGPFSRVDRARYMGRLQSLARRVASWQLSAVAAGGVIRRFDVPLAMVTNGAVFTWPDSSIAIDMRETATSLLEIDPDIDLDSMRVEEIAKIGVVELGGVARQYRARLSEADTLDKTVKLSFVVADLYRVTADGDTIVLDTVPPLERDFDLSFFDFPMIDNTRLSHDQRFAIAMEGFSDDYINIAMVTFPGLYASQRDKPFLDVLIEQLQRNVPFDTAAAGGS